MLDRQRLFARSQPPAPELLAASGIAPGDLGADRFMEGRGCGQCRGTDYKGRKAIAEYMVLNDELRELIVARTSMHEFKAAAARSGTRLLRERGAGETTLQEIKGVTSVG